ncbi:hypothetical protein MNV49_000329 [Pseudohyphozyma bogoriensis]|nr:hypothetical protein MNV49_000329 [Pseudohyphozyma bogoriensis]
MHLLPLLLLLTTAFAQQLSIAGPSALKTCETATIEWSGGTGPFEVDVYVSSPTDLAMEVVASAATGSSVAWFVNIAAGAVVQLGVNDAQGNIALGSNITVAAGSSTSCVNADLTATTGSETQVITYTSKSGSSSSVFNPSGAMSFTGEVNSTAAAHSSTASTTAAQTTMAVCLAMFMLVASV